jgi:hypothetical protein
LTAAPKYGILYLQWGKRTRPRSEKNFDMSRRSNANSASALFNGNRLAADSTHGVTCANRDCRIFDPNILQKHEGKWVCEKHGGENRSVFGKVKDADVGDAIAGSERRKRFARVRARQGANVAPVYSAAKQARIDAAMGNRVGSHGCVNDRKTITPVATSSKKRPAKKSARQEAMELLGLTEADIVAALESN